MRIVGTSRQGFAVTQVTVPTSAVRDFYDRQRQDRERDYPSPACSLITLRGSLSSRKPANFAWRKWSLYVSNCTSSWREPPNRGPKTAPCRPGANDSTTFKRFMQIPPKSNAQFWIVVASAATMSQFTDYVTQTRSSENSPQSPISIIGYTSGHGEYARRGLGDSR